MSQKSPIVKVLKLLQAKLDDLQLRERLLVVATAIMLLGSAWYLGLMQPVGKQIKNTVAEIELVRQRIESVNQSLEIQALHASGGAANYREQFTQVQRRIEELNAKLVGYTAELIGPAEMAHVLQGILKEQSNLRLIRVRNLSPKALSTSDDTDTVFYKHGLELEFEGGYFACLEYLQELEALPWRLYWEILEIEVLEYPLNRIRLEVSTLSPYEEWIGA
ncbi:MAG: type II secretion system protein M [Proteobacteria bacterium]|nr:type II secretion system protein M [Pseudomonadota bacterium]